VEKALREGTQEYLNVLGSLVEVEGHLRKHEEAAEHSDRHRMGLGAEYQRIVEGISRDQEKIRRNRGRLLRRRRILSAKLIRLGGELKTINADLRANQEAMHAAL